MKGNDDPLLLLLIGMVLDMDDTIDATRQPATPAVNAG